MTVIYSNTDQQVSSDAPWPTASKAWWALFVFCLAGLLSYTDRLILSLLVDSIRGDLQISDTEVSLLQGMAFAIIFAIAGFPLGRLTDLRSRRSLLIFGVGMWTLGTVLCGLAHGFAYLFAARALVGVGEAALAPATLSLIADLFPPQRRSTAVGAFMMSLCIGAGVAMSVGGELLHMARSGLLTSLPSISELPPWRIVLLVLGAPGVIVCALLATISEPIRRGVARTTRGHQRLTEALRSLLSLRKTVLPLLGAMALMSAGDFALLNWVPSLLGRVYQLQPEEIGAMVGGVAVATGVSGSLLSGLIGDRLVKGGGAFRRCFVASAGALVSAAAGLIALDWSPVASSACFGLWMFLSWGGQTLAAAALQDAVPNQLRGLGVASMAFCNMALGLTIGTTATALLSDHLFHDSAAIGKSLAIVIAPCALGAAFLYFRAAKALRAEP